MAAAEETTPTPEAWICEIAPGLSVRQVADGTVSIDQEFREGRWPEHDDHIVLRRPEVILLARALIAAHVRAGRLSRGDTG